jgi:hypothetical protein
MANSCKHCGNDTPGAKLYRCRNCGKIHCEDCLPGGNCDNCGVEWEPTFLSMLPFMRDNLERGDRISDDDDDD